jgi:hypothetical protein
MTVHVLWNRLGTLVMGSSRRLFQSITDFLPPLIAGSYKLALHIIVPEQFLHKLNYFSFCQIFEKLFIICIEVFYKIKQILRLKNPKTETV